MRSPLRTFDGSLTMSAFSRKVERGCWPGAGIAPGSSKGQNSKRSRALVAPSSMFRSVLGPDVLCVVGTILLVRHHAMTDDWSPETADDPLPRIRKAPSADLRAHLGLRRRQG